MGSQAWHLAQALSDVLVPIRGSNHWATTASCTQLSSFLPAHHSFLFIRTRPSCHTFAHASPGCPSFSPLLFQFIYVLSAH